MMQCAIRIERYQSCVPPGLTKVALKHLAPHATTIKLSATSHPDFPSSHSNVTSASPTMATVTDKPITLYSVPTPNGIVINILLEELNLAYEGPKYEEVKMSISDSDIGKVDNQVKSPWFLKLNPNGRIPTITDNKAKGFAVFETSAILLYLAQKFDKQHKFSSDVNNVENYSVELQWLFFAHGGIGPMQGQANHFNHYAPEDIPYGKKRYTNETKRLYGVLELRLAESPYLAGPNYGIADIKTYGWVRIADRTSPELELSLDNFPKLKAWKKAIDERPAVKAALPAPK